ncbi:aminopeptidase N [Sutterella sp.]|uniref:aminopeptidase N n=1 Tax=Sutterella sp. TaxID=1981025 RepID=UPI0026DEDF6C|nr:aminopeptidase N [Sutterella sp.]MDO5530624.1 aminopeptidase N [Sutterella sp.]
MAKTIHRGDYRAPTHLIDTIRLEFDLDAETTKVKSVMEVRPNPDSAEQGAALFLNGEDIELVSVSLNGRKLTSGEYRIDKTGLYIPGIRSEAQIEIENTFSPKANTELSGIYSSGENLMSQCESQGFRRITFFEDRPDVLSRYTTVVRGAIDTYPVMLSNGNQTLERTLEDGRRELTFVDPFPKPCYLFALVAGKLVCRASKFDLKDGRTVDLSVWVDPQDIDKTEHTLESLKRAIRWDEERWGLELDLKDFKIVATNDFNFGAMENKGLNVFNSRCALANPAVATDDDYLRIEGVVGHEYFHNWTGDRVTLRDWFQLTLKEGLTVFRDQEFSADMLGAPSARAVQRIRDVNVLRTAQFLEDAGPMAHPIRPDSYQNINNFYTVTVYEKGAEVIRMLQTLLGREVFRKGFDLYIQQNDGHAVTCEAFLSAMAEASGRDLSQFANWYSQSGTPRVTVRSVWDDDNHRLTLTATQATPATPGQPVKKPFLIPFPVAFLDRNGKEMPVQLAEEDEAPLAGTRMFELDREKCEWVFGGLAERPVLSLNRGFAAPVILDAGQTIDDRAFLAAFDPDPFNRWDAMNRLLIDAVHEQTRARLLHQSVDVNPLVTNAAGQILRDETLSPAFKAVALAMPSEKLIAEEDPLIDPHAVHAAWLAVRLAVAEKNLNALLEAAQSNAVDGPYEPTPEKAGRRALRNLALGYAHAAGNPRAAIMIKEQFQQANNLTDRLASLRMMCNSQTPAKQDMELETLKEWHDQPLLINKWLAIQATAPSFPGETPVIERVRQLMQCEFFSIRNPNNVYSLLIPFFQQNPSEFHQPDGSGYAFWAETVLELNAINAQVASRVARSLDNWRRFTPALAEKMHAALESVAAKKSELSPNVAEIIEKALSSPL